MSTTIDIMAIDPGPKRSHIAHVRIASDVDAEVIRLSNIDAGAIDVLGPVGLLGVVERPTIRRHGAAQQLLDTAWEGGRLVGLLQSQQQVPVTTMQSFEWRAILTGCHIASDAMVKDVLWRVLPKTVCNAHHRDAIGMALAYAQSMGKFDIAKAIIYRGGANL